MWEKGEITRLDCLQKLGTVVGKRGPICQEDVLLADTQQIGNERIADLRWCNYKEER